MTIDKNLFWNKHIDEKTDNAIKLLESCKSYIGYTWGLSPKRLQWIYNQVIKPNLTYACFAWAYRCEKQCFLDKLQKVQRHVALAITGGICTTPTQTLEIMAGIMPIELYIQKESIKIAIRLKVNNNWVKNYPIKEVGKLTNHAYYLDKN